MIEGVFCVWEGGKLDCDVRRSICSEECECWEEDWSVNHHEIYEQVAGLPRLFRHFPLLLVYCEWVPRLQLYFDHLLDGPVFLCSTLFYCPTFDAIMGKR